MPAHRATSMLLGGEAASAKFTVPGTAEAGDTLIIWAYNGGGATMTLAGWEKLAETKSSEGVMYVCFALSNWNGSTTEYTVTWTGASYRAGAIQAFKECDTTTPVNVQSGANFKENASSTSATVDGYTTTVNECLRISGVFNNNGATCSPAAGWVEDGDQADSPEVAHRTNLVEAGFQFPIAHTMGFSTITLTLGLALQPPAEPVDLAASLAGEGSLSGSLSVITTLAASLSGAGSLAGAAAAPERIAVRQEYPPDKIALHVQPPQGGPARWAADEALTENVMDDYRHVSEMSGGHKESSMTLARDPRTSWPDLAAYSKVSAYQPGGEEVFAGRLDRAPESDGDHMSIGPELVGHQAALEDDKGLLGPGFINSDLSAWSGTPNARRLLLLNGGWKVGDGSTGTDPVTSLPGLEFTIEGNFPKFDAEAWFDGGSGVRVARLIWDRLSKSNNPSGTDPSSVFEFYGFAADDPAGALEESADTHTANIDSDSEASFEPATARRLVGFSWRYPSAVNDAYQYSSYVRSPKVIADHGLSLQGTWPEVGFSAKQMLEYAVPLYTPLTFDTESEDDDYIIQQAWFSEAGDMATVVRELTKYGLLDWFVYEDEKFQLRFPGTYGRKWQAYAGPSELKEAGLDASRLWRSIVVRFQDVDGSTRTVGPPGSGATVEDAGLEVTDPDHPAVKAELTRKDILDLGTIAVAAEAIVVGERWLEEANLLSRSGSCNLTGYVLDDRGVFRPAAQVKAGDYVRINDAGDQSYRKITRVDYTDAQKQAACSLDGPPQGLQALLERFQATLTPIGLR